MLNLSALKVKFNPIQLTLIQPAVKKSIFILVLIFATFTFCSKDKEIEEVKDPAKDFMEYTNEGLIGAGGGKVQVVEPSSPIKNAFVDVPAGALSSSNKISVGLPDKTFEFAGKSEGIFIELGPSGTKFNSPVTIGIPYDSKENPDEMQVYYFNEQSSVWIPFQKFSIDKDKKLILAKTNHFTIVTAQKSGYKFDMNLFKKDNKIFGKVWLLTPFGGISTNLSTLAGTGCSNIKDLILKTPLSVHLCYKISLKEKVDWWFDKTIDTREIIYGIWRYNNFTTYEVRTQDSKGEVLLETNDSFLDFSSLEKYMSGNPLVIYFPNAQIESTKKYYLDVELYFADSWGVNKSVLFFASGISANSFEDAVSPDLIVKPNDVDGDGIVDLFDKQNGNPPVAPFTPNPGNNVTNISTSPTLTWDCSDPDNDPITYDVYFGTDNPPATKVSPAQSGKSLVRSGLDDGKTYYWKVVAYDGKGNVTESPVWKFTTIAAANQPPAAPSNPTPTHNADGISTSPTLSWNCSDPENDPITYDVYFGTNNPPTEKVATGQTAKTLSRSSLPNNTPYYWQITAKDNKGNSTQSPVWKFTTQVNTGGNNEISYFTDSRDIKTYKIVKIGNQWWMAENLAFLPTVSPSKNGSDKTPYYYVYGYEGSIISSAKSNPNYTDYGVLYNWEAAKIACPDGWHLPNDEEWKQLEMTLGMSRSQADIGDGVEMRGTNQGAQLKNSSGWNDSGNGTNSSDFSALPGGARFGDGFFSLKGIEGNWWSSTLFTDNLNVWDRRLNNVSSKVGRWITFKSVGLSVRCVKNSEITGYAPVADFTASKTNITKGETIQFNDKSTNSPTSWLWDFGDVTTSTQQNPSKTYNSVGNYSVTLKATNGFGNSTKTINITVTEQSEIKYGELVYDGRTYKTVIINGKEWMAENLAYLPAVYPSSNGSNTEPRYYVYKFQSTDVATAKQNANYTTYGVIYNWFAAKAACPPGWHLPTDDEWKQLEMALGMTQAQADATDRRGTDQGTQMKSTSGWHNNGNGTNTSGFSALPGGCLSHDGGFYNIGPYGYWWSATEYSTANAWFRALGFDGGSIDRRIFGKEYGLSVRCVRD